MIGRRHHLGCFAGDRVARENVSGRRQRGEFRDSLDASKIHEVDADFQDSQGQQDHGDTDGEK